MPLQRFDTDPSYLAHATSESTPSFVIKAKPKRRPTGIRPPETSKNESLTNRAARWLIPRSKKSKRIKKEDILTTSSTIVLPVIPNGALVEESIAAAADPLDITQINSIKHDISPPELNDSGNFSASLSSLKIDNQLDEDDINNTVIEDEDENKSLINHSKSSEVVMSRTGVAEVRKSNDDLKKTGIPISLDLVSSPIIEKVSANCIELPKDLPSPSSESEVSSDEPLTTEPSTLIISNPSESVQIDRPKAVTFCDDVVFIESTDYRTRQKVYKKVNCQCWWHRSLRIMEQWNLFGCMNNNDESFSDVSSNVDLERTDTT